MAARFHRGFFKDYQFWTLFVALCTLAAMTYFASQAAKIQSALKSIEQARQNERFCNDLEVQFVVSPSSTYRIEEAEYDLKCLNHSPYIFEFSKIKADIFFENQQTQEIKKFEIFTLQPTKLIPSDKPLYLLKNPQLTNTFRNNISEVKKKTHEYDKPKCIHFFFRWRVDIGEGEYREIDKHKYFHLEKAY